MQAAKRQFSKIVSGPVKDRQSENVKPNSGFWIEEAKSRFCTRASTCPSLIVEMVTNLWISSIEMLKAGCCKIPYLSVHARNAVLTSLSRLTWSSRSTCVDGVADWKWPQFSLIFISPNSLTKTQITHSPIGLLYSDCATYCKCPISVARAVAAALECRPTPTCP